MNASMNDTERGAGPVASEVRDYVARVRAALADLPAEDVDEFTTGMEADLAERLAEPGRAPCVTAWANRTRMPQSCVPLPASLRARPV